jgi:hypothetical protein
MTRPEWLTTAKVNAGEMARVAALGALVMGALVGAIVVGMWIASKLIPGLR